MKKRTLKKKNYILWGVGVSVVLILLIIALYFGLKQQQFIGVNTVTANINPLTTTQYSTIYSYSYSSPDTYFISSPGSNVVINGARYSVLGNNIPFSITLSPEYGNDNNLDTTNLQTNTLFNATNVQLSLPFSDLYNNIVSNNWQIENLSAQCELINNQLICTYSGDIVSLDNGTIIGPNSGTYSTNGNLTVEILNNNIQCTTTQLLCTSNQICSNNQCIIPTSSNFSNLSYNTNNTQTYTIYQFSNNQCTPLTITTVVTNISLMSNQYLTLTECQANIITQTTNQTNITNPLPPPIYENNTFMEVVVGIVVLVVIGIVLYLILGKKKGRKGKR